jgi:hypothetical protein
VIAARRSSLGAIAAALLLLSISAASASPPPPAAPHWVIVSTPAPTYFKAGDEGDYYEVIAVNDGPISTDGSTITMTEALPPGVTATAIRGDTYLAKAGSEVHLMECAMTTCETTAAIRSGEVLRMKVIVTVAEGASGTLADTATISGGGALSASATGATPVSAETVPFGVSLAASLTGEGGEAERQAGSHPFTFTQVIPFNTGSVSKTLQCTPEPNSYGCPILNSDARNVDIALPAGLIGNPQAGPRCSQPDFQTLGSRNQNCPADTQVGRMQVYFYGNSTAPQFAPVYNVEPPPGEPAELGFSVGGVYHIPIFFQLRSDGDYGLTAQVRDIAEADPVQSLVLSIWGVPAAADHDNLRGGPGCLEGCPSDAPLKPFLSLPTACSGSELPLSIGGDSWQEPGVFVPAPPTTLAGMTGCNQLEFEPTLQARPTTNLADSPSGLHVDLKLPQPEDPEGLAEAHLKEAKVTLPKGLTVNPSSAAGREGCSPSQIGLTSAQGATPIHFTGDPAACPDASKLGTVEVDTPLLEHSLPGAVYLAQPYANPFKSLLALYITVNDPKTNIVVKLAGQVEIAPDGQLTTTVSESPQVPFEDFKLDFFDGARAPLRTPAVCGTYETTSQLTPWSAPESGPPASKSDAYAISAGPNGHNCANSEAAEPNAPSFEAGTASPLAGAYSPFSLHLHREDGSQNFSALNVNLPPGLIGKLAGVGECPDSALATAAGKSGAAEQASPSCPAASRLGTVNVAAGAGPSPFNAGGTAYLAGPYKGAPLSVAIVTPAVAGPFDLGTVVVRNALHVNPETAQVSVTSDPIPTALQGIQLDIRSIDVNLDRNQFTLNPTNCERSAVTGTEVSSQGSAASLTNPFQVGECGRLGFKPKLSLKLKGATKRAQNPAFSATLTMPPGGANIASAQVTLPHSEFLDNAHIKTVCTRVQFAANECPAASIYGHARAITPLLDAPLEGPVYLRSSSNKLPDLVAALGGQINVVLDGRVDSVHARLRNSFEAVPDAPVSKFTLEMQGGKKGLLVNSENICKAPQRATVKFTGQNGKNEETSPLLKVKCAKHGKKHKRHHQRHTLRAAG